MSGIFGGEVVVAWLVALLLFADGIVSGGVRLWKRRQGFSLAAKLVGGAGLLAAMWGVVGTVLGMLSAFGAVGGESLDPSQKARILAEGISEAMNCSAFGVLVIGGTIAVLLVLTRKAKPAVP